MFKSGSNKFLKLFNAIIGIQMCFSPIVFAQEATAQAKAQAQRAAVENSVATFNHFAQTAISAYTGGATGSLNPQQLAQQSETQQVIEALRIKPVDQSQIPPVFAGCYVLPASGNKLTGNKSCGRSSASAIAGGYAEAIIGIAEFNKSQLQNFQVSGHERNTSQGQTCYDNKIKDFETQLKAREEELSRVKRALQESVAKFTQNNKQLLDTIKKESALITGKPADLLEQDVFEKAFFGANGANSNCGTFLAANDLTQFSSGGFTGIKKGIYKKTNDNSNNKMTANQLLSEAGQLTQAILNLGNKAVEKLNGTSALGIEEGGVTLDNKFMTRLEAPFNQALKNHSLEMSNKLDIVKRNNDIDKLDQTIVSNIDKDLNVDNELENFKRLKISECVQKRVGTNGKKLLSNLYNSTVSKHKQGKIKSTAQKRIEDQINNKYIDFDQLRDAVNQFAKSNPKARVKLTTAQVDGSFTRAPGSYSITSFIDEFENSCIDEFANDPQENGLTHKYVYDGLKAYAEARMKLKDNSASLLKAKLQKDIISCSNDTTTGIANNSCGDALNPSAGSFCIASASRCAQNMNKCLNQADTVLKQVTRSQENNANQYNANFNQLKNGLKVELAGLENFVINQSRSLDAQLNIGTLFNMPDNDPLSITGLFPLQDEEGLDKKLKLEDPEQMLERATEKIDSLQVALKKHSRDLLNKVNETKNNYLANYATQEAYWDQVINECSNAHETVKKQLAEQEQKRQEDQRKIETACQELRAFNEVQECDGLSDFIDDVSEVAITSASVPGANVDQSQNARGIASLKGIRRACKVESIKAEEQSVDPDEDSYTSYCKGEGKKSSTCKTYSRKVADYKGCVEKVSKSFKDKVTNLDKDKPYCFKYIDGAVRLESKSDMYEKDSNEECKGDYLLKKYSEVISEMEGEESLAESKLNKFAKTHCGVDKEDIAQLEEKLEEPTKEYLTDRLSTGFSPLGQQGGKISLGFCNANIPGTDPFNQKGFLEQTGNAIGRTIAVESAVQQAR